MAFAQMLMKYFGVVAAYADAHWTEAEASKAKPSSQFGRIAMKLPNHIMERNLIKVCMLPFNATIASCIISIEAQIENC